MLAGIPLLQAKLGKAICGESGHSHTDFVASGSSDRSVEA